LDLGTWLRSVPTIGDWLELRLRLSGLEGKQELVKLLAGLPLRVVNRRVALAIWLVNVDACGGEQLHELLVLKGEKGKGLDCVVQRGPPLLADVRKAKGGLAEDELSKLAGVIEDGVVQRAIAAVVLLIDVRAFVQVPAKQVQAPLPPEEEIQQGGDTALLKPEELKE